MANSLPQSNPVINMTSLSLNSNVERLQHFYNHSLAQVVFESYKPMLSSYGVGKGKNREGRGLAIVFLPSTECIRFVSILTGDHLVAILEKVNTCLVASQH